MDIKNQVQLLEKDFAAQIGAAKNAVELEKVRVEFLGRSGKIIELTKQLKGFSLEDKKAWGPKFNELKKAAEKKFQTRRDDLQYEQIRQAEKAQIDFDVTACIPNQPKGSLHPCSKVIRKIEDVFISMGYQIADGPELEDDYHNFEALNIAPDHPARDMQDTFWLTLPGKLMRTQTSPVQVRTMENQKPPIAILAPGRCYRNESTDASHDFVFWQAEGLLIDKNISMTHLLATMKTCLRAIFEKDELDIRVRPGYFPFVEPGVEIDMQCPFCEKGCSVCKQTRWIEICGGGLVHPNVLRASGVDPDEYSGFAFGFGLTRLVILKYGINDLRFLSDGKLDFLNQF